jgi:shikimate kinase
MDPNTRALIAQKGISIWLKADLDVLLRRTKRRGERPLADRMRELLPLREPIYALADVTIQSREEPHDMMVGEILAGIAGPLGIEYAESHP